MNTAHSHCNTKSLSHRVAGSAKSSTVLTGMNLKVNPNPNVRDPDYRQISNVFFRRPCTLQSKHTGDLIGASMLLPLTVAAPGMG